MTQPTAEQVRETRRRREERGMVRITPNDRWAHHTLAAKMQKEINDTTKEIEARYRAIKENR